MGINVSDLQVEMVNAMPTPEANPEMIYSLARAVVRAFKRKECEENARLVEQFLKERKENEN